MRVCDVNVELAKRQKPRNSKQGLQCIRPVAHTPNTTEYKGVTYLARHGPIMYVVRIFSFSNALAALDLEFLVVHHELLCPSLFAKILQDRAHARTFDVKFKSYRARNSLIISQCLSG